VNTLALVVIVALLADFLLQSTADYLNIRRSKMPVPRVLEGLYDDTTRDRAVRHLSASTGVGLVERAVLLVCLLAFWLLGGFGFIDELICGQLSGVVSRGLAYVGLLGFGYGLLELPFDGYRTFVVEERFGLNRTSVSTFVADRLKGLVVTAAIGAPLLVALLLLFSRLPDIAWLLCWAVVVLFSIGVQFVAPAIILPWFNRFEPMQEGQLKDAILSYARGVGFSLDNVFVIDGSKRTTKGNAFFTGFGRHRRIALYDTLVAGHPADEIVAVLAHEVGHYRRRHLIKGLALGAAHSAVLLFLFSIVLDQPVLYEAFLVPEPSVYAGLVCFAILLSPLETSISLALNTVTRSYEYEADRFAVETAPIGSALSSALKRLSVGHLSNPNPHPLYVAVNYSHPPLAERLEAIETRAAVQSQAEE
jgi:STE24 endopeptidase